jgi:hypothetical protein
MYNTSCEKTRNMSYSKQSVITSVKTGFVGTEIMTEGEIIIIVIVIIKVIIITLWP